MMALFLIAFVDGLSTHALGILSERIPLIAEAGMSSPTAEIGSAASTRFYPRRSDTNADFSSLLLAIISLTKLLIT